MTARKLTTLGLLTGLALIIFIVELRLPDLTPIPGVKLGLANIITVYAVFRFKPSEAVMLVAARIILARYSAVISQHLSTVRQEHSFALREC